jgi:hypothetical protein
VQLQRRLPDIEAAGIALFAISYDSQQALGAFGGEHGITYPLLSDQASEVIKRFGILNTLVRADEPVYGIPYPGSYFVDESGVVVAKFFHRRYQVRDAVESVLHEVLGVPLPADLPSAEEASEGVRVTVALGAEELAFQRRAHLYVRLALDEGLHLYGQPVPEGYFATEVIVSGPEGLIVEEPRYPPTHELRIEELDEKFNVYEGEVEIVVPVIANIREVDSVPIEVSVQYQACDEHQCFIPQRKVLRLDVPLRPLNRAPRRD